MALESWIAFCLISAALVATPGPITLFIMSSTLSLGRRKAARIIPGVLMGDLLALSASLLGADLVLSRYPYLFTGLKVTGAAILILLGLRAIIALSDAPIGDATQPPNGNRRLFFGGFALAALHPSGFVFFTAFAPQFVDPSAPFTQQATILIATFLTIVGLSGLCWLHGVELTQRLLVTDRAHHIIQLGGGILLVLVGLGSLFLIGFG